VSYRERRLRKNRRAKTPGQLRRALPDWTLPLDFGDQAAAVDECPRCHRAGRQGVSLPHATGCASA